MPIDLNLPRLLGEADSRTRLPLGETKRRTFRPDSPGSWPTWLPTLSWHHTDLLLLPKCEAFSGPTEASPAKRPKLDGYHDASFELRIHTANL